MVHLLNCPENLLLKIISHVLIRFVKENKLVLKLFFLIVFQMEPII